MCDAFANSHLLDFGTPVRQQSVWELAFKIVGFQLIAYKKNKSSE